jgi:uncharacterized protein (DUF2252 family)
MSPDRDDDAPREARLDRGVLTSRPKRPAQVEPDERAAAGRAARADAPRSMHGVWSPAADRRDPVAVLEEQAASRVPELVPIRYGRMLVSAFTFYRGGAALMAADLADAPRTGLQVQLCGDAHLSNFGAFAAPDRRLVFGVNDFDETLPGPFEWDVKRLAASLEVAARDRGFDDKQRAAIVASSSRAYRETMQSFATMGALETWYARQEIDDFVGRALREGSPKQVRRLERNVAKARSKDSLKAFAKLTAVVDGELRIAGDPPLITPIEDIAEASGAVDIEPYLRSILTAYRRSLSGDLRRLLERFRYVHAARKVVGVGSVGTRAWIALLLGRDERDPLFLQFKEAQASVLEPYLGASRFSNHGQRVVEGQRLMQAAPDIMLGWIRMTEPQGARRDFYVRQLWDQKGSALVELMNPLAMTVYGEVCARTLARAHARSGDAIAIAAYLGTGRVFDRAMAAFASAYADQNERDYAAVEAAVADGRLTAAVEPA